MIDDYNSYFLLVLTINIPHLRSFQTMGLRLKSPAQERRSNRKNTQETDNENTDKHYPHHFTILCTTCCCQVDTLILPPQTSDLRIFSAPLSYPQTISILPQVRVGVRVGVLHTSGPLPLRHHRIPRASAFHPK